MEVIEGNIFTTKCQTIVNTVNCFGVMGAGIALECKYRYPQMNERYVELCKNQLLQVGNLFLYKTDKKWILNFPTKNHWKFPSKKEYLEKGLQKFVDTYQIKGITSIAFPLLGASHGGLSSEDSFQIMEEYLKDISIPIEVYKYNPEIADDLFPKFLKFLQSSDLARLKLETGLSKKQLKILLDAIETNSIYNMIGLLSIKGVGEKAIQKCYVAAMQLENQSIQGKLF